MRIRAIWAHTAEEGHSVRPLNSWSRQYFSKATIVAAFVVGAAFVPSTGALQSVFFLQPACAQGVDAGRSRIPTAIQFPIVFKSVIDSAHAADGDQVEAALKEDIVIDDELIAPAGSVVLGHIAKLRPSRRMAESLISKHRRFHKGSSLKIELDEIITDEDEHIKIVGCLSKQSCNFIESKQPREVEIGANGELQKAEAVFTPEQKVASQVVNFAASSGVNQLGTAASFGALPVVMGVIGAVEPSIVMSKPMAADEKHPRVKGFAYGVFTSLPGAPVIQAVTFKGSELRIEPGDEFLAQAHSPYEPQPVLTISSKILRKESTSVSAKNITPSLKNVPAAPQVSASSAVKAQSL